MYICMRRCRRMRMAFTVMMELISIESCAACVASHGSAVWYLTACMRVACVRACACQLCTSFHIMSHVHVQRVRGTT